MSSQEFASVDREFFKQLAEMMRAKGVAVGAAKAFHPTSKDLEAAEDILSGATFKSSGASIHVRPEAFRAIEKRLVCNVDQLKQFLVRGGTIGHFEAEGALSTPASAVINVRDAVESIFYSTALTKILAIDTRTFFKAGFSEGKVPSVAASKGSVIALRVNNATEKACVEVIPPERAACVKLLFTTKATGATPFCPAHLLESDPALADGKYARRSKRGSDDLVDGFNRVLRRYGVSKQQAAQFIANAAQKVSFTSRGVTHYLAFKRVTFQSVLRVLEGRPRQGDQLRLDFIDGLCEALKSNTLINLRECAEIISRDEFKSRFPGKRISDKYLRLSLKQRHQLESNKQRKSAPIEDRTSTRAPKQQKAIDSLGPTSQSVTNDEAEVNLAEASVGKRSYFL